jgi:tRNA A37 N6-isopentenylltransferase MiaA
VFCRYTTTDPPSKPNVALIIGGVVGGLAAILLGFIFIQWLRRRRHRVYIDLEQEDPDVYRLLESRIPASPLSATSSTFPEKGRPLSVASSTGDYLRTIFSSRPPSRPASIHRSVPSQDESILMDRIAIRVDEMMQARAAGPSNEAPPVYERAPPDSALPAGKQQSGSEDGKVIIP